MKLPRKVAIIGAGVVGTAIGYLLKKAGYPIVGIASRTLQSAQKARDFIKDGNVSTDIVATARKADIVFITTSDNAIEEVCDKIASGDGFKPGTIVFHTCGALPSNILKSAKKNGSKIASLHPLQSLANARKAVKDMPGSYFCLEGDAEALLIGREIIKVLKGKEIILDVEKKTLYHAGASVASNFLSNFLVATVDFGLNLFELAGIDRKDSLKALMPLIKGTVKNIETIGIPAALTGPIWRGDAGVIEDHLKVIQRNDMI
jgi:predicted short-subunit dehydrogenase-like oxidoreductase (DUF2520 family)